MWLNGSKINSNQLILEIVKIEFKIIIFIKNSIDSNMLGDLVKILGVLSYFVEKFKIVVFIGINKLEQICESFKLNIKFSYSMSV